MKRYVCAFALLGFLTVVVMALFQDQPLAEVLPRAFKWAAIFGVLGLALGYAAQSLLEEARIGEEYTRQGEAVREARKHTDAVDLMAQGLMAREVQKSPILLQALEPGAEKDDEPGPLATADRGEHQGE